MTAGAEQRVDDPARAPDGLPALSPYVGLRTEAVAQAVRALLGLPAAVPLAAERLPDADLGVAATIGTGPDALCVELREGTHRAWFAGASFSAAYRNQPDGRSPYDDADLRPLLDRLRGRLRALDEAGHDGPWGALSRTLAEVRATSELRDSMYRSVTPREALVRLGFRCNQKCDFCWQNRSWPDAPTEYYFRWVDEIADAGYQQVALTGGEPTIHPDFLPLVHHARARGLEVLVQTNAIQLARPGRAAELFEAGVTSAFISFHSHVAEVSDAMTRAPKTHARTASGISEALRAGMRVLLNCVVDARNAGLLADYAEHVVATYVQGHPDNPIQRVELSHPCRYYETDAWEQNLAPLDELAPQLIRATTIFRDAGVLANTIGTCGFPPCLLQGDAASLRAFCRSDEADGDVEGRAFAAVCDACAFRPHCLGVRQEYLARFGDRGLHPFTEVPDSMLGAPA